MATSLPNPDQIIEVLLPDGWHAATDFDGAVAWPYRAGGPDYVPARATPGFIFSADDGAMIAGPLESILAVKYGEPAEPTGHRF